MFLKAIKLVSGDLLLAEVNILQNGIIEVLDCQVIMQSPVYGGQTGTQLVGMSLSLIDFIPTDKPFSISNINTVAMADPDGPTVRMWEFYKNSKLGITVPEKPRIEVVQS